MLTFPNSPLMLIIAGCWVALLLASVAKRLIAKICLLGPVLAIPATTFFIWHQQGGLSPLAVASSPYFLFFSALLTSFLSDLEEMTIPRLASIWLAPIWLILAYFGQLPISFTESLIGFFLGAAVPLCAALIFRLIYRKDGLGMGDAEMLAMIGAVVGLAINDIFLLANLLGIVWFVARALLYGKEQLASRLPFAPCIVLSTTIKLFFNWSFF